MPATKKKFSGLVDAWGRRRNRKLLDRACAECGKVFRPIKKDSKYCSRRCAWANNGGHNKKAESWWKTRKGYIEGRIWLPDGTQIYIKQHRFVMEGMLGRPLSATEDVHHINGDKADNRPDNLQLVDHGTHSTQSNLNRVHRKEYKLRLSDEERKARSLRAIARSLWVYGHAALTKARGVTACHSSAATRIGRRTA